MSILIIAIVHDIFKIFPTISKKTLLFNMSTSGNFWPRVYKNLKASLEEMNREFRIIDNLKIYINKHK